MFLFSFLFLFASITITILHKEDNDELQTFIQEEVQDLILENHAKSLRLERELCRTRIKADILRRITQMTREQKRSSLFDLCDVDFDGKGN